MLIRVLSLSFLLVAAGQPIRAQEAAEVVPARDQFAPIGKARYIAGELVYIDPVNRRGAIRLHGDANGRYWTGSPHYFALLPYATVWYHGAHAELRDVPLGTRRSACHVRVAASDDDRRPRADRSHHVRESPERLSAPDDR